MGTAGFEERGYDRMAIALHWFLALALVGQVLLGWYVHDIPRGTPARGWFINLHKSIGLTLGLFILLRVYWRLRHGAPRPASGASALQRRIAGAAHAALYACMLGLPLTGYVASNFSKHGVKLFNAVLLPPWATDSPAVYAALNGLHRALAWTLVALVVVHVLAALRHLVLRDGVFQRMLPARKARPA